MFWPQIVGQAVLALFGFSLFFAITIKPGSAVLGGVTLRVFGVGGGIPIVVTLRRTLDGSNAGVKIFNGCLVLWIGDEITLAEKHDRKCHLIARSGTVRSNDSVATFQASDIIEIEKLGWYGSSPPH